MVWPILDYFKCEPFELNFRMLVLGGFWPLETNDRKKQIIFSIFSYVCFFSVSSMCIVQCLDVYLLRNDIAKLSYDLCAIPISLAIVIKSHLLLYNIDLVNELKRELNHYKRTRTDPEEVEILEKSNYRILYIVKTFYGITIPCVIIWIIYPGLDSSEENGILFPYRISVEEWSRSVYIGVYTYQAMAIFGYMINVLSVDSIFCGFVLRINAHYNVILKNFKILQDEDFDGADGNKIRIVVDGKNDEEEIIRENVRLHKKILYQLDIFGKIYKTPSLVHLVGVTTAIGAVVLDTVVLSREFKLKILQRVLYLTVALWDTLLYCYCASMLQEKSLAVGFAAYSTNWYRMKKKERKDLSMFMMKCQKTPKIYVGNFFPLELHTFVSASQARKGKFSADQKKTEKNMGSNDIILSKGYPLDYDEDAKTEKKLVNCKNCGRHFAIDRIETHEYICQKQKKRKPFDTCMQRIRGTDAEKFMKKNKAHSKPEKPSPQKNWRKQHEEFINSMKAARQVTAFLKKGGNIRDLPPPPPSDYSDYIQCPTCLRKFNSSAAERHIPKCANMQHNKPKPVAPKNAAKVPPPKLGAQLRTRK